MLIYFQGIKEPCIERTGYRGTHLRVTREKRGDRFYERVYVRPGLCVIPITDEGKVRVIRERDSYSGRMRTKLVSAYIEDDEEPLVCAKRELDEEIGHTAQTWVEFLRSESEEGAIAKKQYYFIARGLTVGTAHPEATEEIGGWFDLSFEEIRQEALQGTFGTTATAYALLKLTAPPTGA